MRDPIPVWLEATSDCPFLDDRRDDDHRCRHPGRQGFGGLCEGLEAQWCPLQTDVPYARRIYDGPWRRRGEPSQ